MARQTSEERDMLALQYAAMLDRLLSLRQQYRGEFTMDGLALVNRAIISLLIECRDAGLSDAIEWL